MRSKNIELTEAELSNACYSIEKQFIAQCCWPCEQPIERIE